MTNSNRDRALSHIETVERLRVELREEYDDPNKRRHSVIGRLNGDLGLALKLAGIHAQLATADAVHDAGADLFAALRRADAVTHPAFMGAEMTRRS